MTRIVNRIALASVVMGLFALGIPAKAAMIEVRVSSGTDDAEQHLNEGDSIDLTSSDLELGAEGGGSDIQEIGIRFQDVQIPAGSVITSAAIQFTVDETDDEPTSVLIYGELAANPGAYTGAAGEITARTKTTSVVAWNDIPVWDTVGADGPDQRTPDLTALVQEIIGLGGWASGNAMAFIISPTAENSERTAESFNGSPSQAALLQVEYVPEPATIVMLAIGFLGLSFCGIRRSRRLV